jgi:5'-deoxynucleotidase YfbR-like HD superfamily hydrolase
MTEAFQKTTAAKQSVSLEKYISLFREIGNIKRIRAAGSGDSIAARIFERAWGRINGGEALRSVAVTTVAEAVIAANLGAIDTPVLRSAELSNEEIEVILTRAFDNAASGIDEKFLNELRGEVKQIACIRQAENSYQTAQFVENLKNQPRSGATKVGAPKRIFDQPENHAEHCLAVAVIGALLADHFKADFETVFLIGLIHHFHNAYLPDSGFAGEEALGEFLPRIFDSFRRKCLREVPENLHEKIWKLFETIETADAPESKVFHAADVFDRVLQMKHHAETNEFTLKYAMEEAELVHAGAVQEFHYDVLRQAQLIG